METNSSSSDYKTNGCLILRAIEDNDALSRHATPAEIQAFDSINEDTRKGNCPMGHGLCNTAALAGGGLAVKACGELFTQPDGLVVYERSGGMGAESLL